MICPSCTTQCSDGASFCENCGRRVSGGRTPWMLLGCPALLLILIAIAAVVGLLLKQVG